MSDRQTLANALRFLSMDAVQKANSGHPGAPMGMADIAEVLWNDFLSHNPENPSWLNRDRFVLSNGHASMLLYSLLHLTGYDLSIEDLKQFRQLHSKTPGHPELGYTPGVETTTGPLGQGLANAVGMALAETMLAEQFNRPEFNLIDHHTYVFLGDGCLMEGISHEAASFAGTLKLGKLIAFWDDNQISIDGHVSGWFTDDTPERFRAYGWHVIANIDGHDPKAIRNAIQDAQTETEKPTLICCRTTIACGAPTLAGSEEAHGSPLGLDEIQATRTALKWPYAPFEIPETITKIWNAREKGRERQKKWDTLFAAYQKKHSKLALELIRRTENHLPTDWDTIANTCIEHAQHEGKTMATRKASQWTLNQIAPHLPELFGGSADLSGSNCTQHQNSVTYAPTTRKGNYLHYGVREFGMSAIMNGIALYRGFVPYGGTFLVFTDYARNAIRLSAIMKQQVIYVLTHDSIGLGEDGPTHQPVEHAAMLRLTPNVHVWRPCDQAETTVAWIHAIKERHAPSCLLLTRQNTPLQPRSQETLHNIVRGGYILKDVPAPRAVIIATGSEVELAIAAADELNAEGHAVRVVSMPCTALFDRQTREYRDHVLPPHLRARVAVEAAAKDFWYKYVGLDGHVIGLDRFGESAPYQAIYETLGITTKTVVDAVKHSLYTQSD